MASRRTTAARPRAIKADAVAERDIVSSDVAPRTSAISIAPLIPERLAYKYDHVLMQRHYDNLVRKSRAHNAAHRDVTPKRYLTANLVTLICRLYEKNILDAQEQCDEAVKECLPVREHNAAYMTHSLFVTMVGMVVARALEQANAAVGSGKWDDLLLNRYYVRNITTHDSSKTSALETAAYSGIMAYFMEKEQKCPHHEGIEAESVINHMANYGVHHHYAHNPHHPQHNAGGPMEELDVIEAVVDGLACTLERKNYKNATGWIDGYFVKKFADKKNLDFAQCIINALKIYITDADYQALLAFRRAVHAITGAYVPWTCEVKVTREVPRIEDMQAKKKRTPRAK